MGSADSHHDFRESTLLTPRTQRKTRPRTRQPPPAAAPALRRQVADSPDREPARPLTTLGGVAPDKERSMTGAACWPWAHLLDHVRRMRARLQTADGSRSGRLAAWDAR